MRGPPAGTGCAASWLPAVRQQFSAQVPVFQPLQARRARAAQARPALALLRSWLPSGLRRGRRGPRRGRPQQAPRLARRLGLPVRAPAGQRLAPSCRPATSIRPPGLAALARCDCWPTTDNCRAETVATRMRLARPWCCHMRRAHRRVAIRLQASARLVDAGQWHLILSASAAALWQRSIPQRIRVKYSSGRLCCVTYRYIQHLKLRASLPYVVACTLVSAAAQERAGMQILGQAVDIGLPADLTFSLFGAKSKPSTSKAARTARPSSRL